MPTTTNELVADLRESYRSSWEQWPTDAEIEELAAVATDDKYASAAALSVLLRLNGKYRDGGHASARIAGVVHSHTVRYMLQPAYVPAVADVLYLMERNGLSQENAVIALGGQN